jgi:hypothetical protein
MLASCLAGQFQVQVCMEFEDQEIDSLKAICADSWKVFWYHQGYSS